MKLFVGNLKAFEMKIKPEKVTKLSENFFCVDSLQLLKV